MTLTLTSAEQALLADVQRELLSPLTHPDAAAWSRAASEPAKSLLGAERGGMILPDHDMLLCPEDGYDSTAISAYPDLTNEMDRRYRFFERLVRLGAYHRALAWGPYLDEYYSSDYFNEFIVPNRFFGAIGLAEPMTGGARVHTVAQFLFHRDRERPGDVERDLAVLRLMLPAFSAGVRMWRQAVENRLELDRFSDGVLLIHRERGVEHRNRAATRMLANGPGWKALEEPVAELTRILSAAAAEASEIEDHLMTSRGTLRSGDYRLSMSRVPEDRYGRDIVGMICIRDTGTFLPTRDEIQARHDLTERQAEVALLLARRLRNDEIADTLGLSPHTTKRHTEAILMKLGVSSRDEVKVALEPSESRMPSE